jgi:cell wall assembly regulator SMI1
MELNKFILAVIALKPGKVGGCGAPIFYVENKEEQDKIATTLARITEGVVHDLENGIYIIVKH